MADPVAIYGAAIGSAAAVGVAWRIYHDAFRDKARLRLLLGKEFRPRGGEYTILSPNPEHWSETATWYPDAEVLAVVNVANVGKRPLTVNGAGLEFKNEYRIVFEPGKAGNLEEGESLLFSISEPSLSNVLQHLGLPRFVFAMDASGRVYRSSIESSLVKWLEELGSVEVN